MIQVWLWVAVVPWWAERRAAPKPAHLAMCLRLDAASIAVPSGASAGHIEPSGLDVPAEALRREEAQGYPLLEKARTEGRKTELESARRRIEGED